MVNLKSHYDAVIVGGGHNGLVAANYLAGAGLDVLVLEQQPEMGGATVSSRIFPDFDAKISRYAYLISLLPTEILDELGIDFRTRRRRTASFTPYTNDQGQPDGLLLSNVDEVVSKQSFIDKAGNAAAWDRYQQLLQLEQTISQIAWPTLTKPLVSRNQLVESLRSEADKVAWNWFVDRPLGEAIEHFIDDDLIRGLVMTDGKIGVFTHPHDPSLIQNRCFLYHVIGRGTGEWQVPIGGMGGLVRSLVDAAVKRNATLIADARVSRVVPGAKYHAVEVEWQGETTAIDATRILFNASPKNIASMLGKNWQPIATDEGSVVKVNMLLQKLPRLKAKSFSAEDAFTGSLHINEGYQQMIDAYGLALRGCLPDPAPCEIYCHTLTDNSILSEELRKNEYHTLTLFGLDAPYRLFTNDNETARDEFSRRYLDGIDSFCEGSFRDCLARDSDGKPCVEIKTALDLETEVGLDLGNIFHNSLSWFFTDNTDEVGSWGVETDDERIYLCGSSAARGGAVSGIPGHNAAMKIFEELGIDSKRK